MRLGVDEICVAGSSPRTEPRLMCGGRLWSVKTSVQSNFTKGRIAGAATPVSYDTMRSGLTRFHNNFHVAFQGYNLS